MSLLPARPSLFSRARLNCDLAPREALQYAELSAQDVRATLSHSVVPSEVEESLTI